MCGPVGRKVCGVSFGGVTGGLVGGVCVCVYRGCVVKEMPESDHCVLNGLGVLSAWVICLGMAVCCVL